ncbi:MAG: S8 family serine peptidase [Succinimonas sp.]|nr:S8 family serine peptidase [Succinimonas sp.]
MKTILKKGLRLTGTAAAVSAILLTGTMFSGCDDSKNWINDGVKLTVAEEGDLATGKPYKLKASRHLQELSADHGEVSSVNPVTGENAGANEWFYVFSEENFASYELDADNNVNDGDGAGSSLKDFTETFHATLTDGRTRKVKQTFAGNDPLLPDQWHLWNISQNPYGVTDAPLKKIDINVIPAWRIILPEDKKQIDGSGVYVAVYDSPVDLNHEDLRDRIYDPKVAGAEDIINIGLPLEKLKENASVHHGTSVAGITAASAMNKLGGRGLAFNAMLTSFANSAADESLNLGAMLKMDHLNLVNASIGTDLISYHRQVIWDLYEALFENNIAFIHAQGNEFRAGKATEAKPYSRDTCLKFHAECEYKQTDVKARFPFIIHVGALNSLGVKASYGSTGSNLWVTGFGGEFGADVTDPSGTKSSAAMVTTLTSYDPKEFDDTDKNSPWRTEENKYYTNTMNGTSSAAPSVSGAVALAYQARPDMTVSELRYLLAKTARDDTVMPTLALTPLEADDDTYKEKVILDYGWQDNAAGYRFSNWYGFGVVDAEALVRAALDCDNDPVCAGMKELPEKYVSANEKPCAYADDSKRLITCSFSDFKNEEGESLGKTELLADTVTYDVSGMNYLPEGIIEACELAASEEDEETTEHNVARKQAIFDANLLLEITAESEAGTKSLLKPIYANWDYRSGLKVPENDGDDDLPEGFALEPLELATSAFYQEHLKEDPDKKYHLSVKSPCQIDADKLNKTMHLTVYGRRK